MRYLLDLVYSLLLIFISPLILHAAIFRGKYRQGFAAKLLGLIGRRSGHGPCVWLHGVSVGEINVLVHLVPQLERQHPDHEIVISSTTRTGFQLASKRFPHRFVFYCPLDFSWAVSAVLRRLRPQLLVLVELELWPNLILAAQRAGTRILVVNGRLSETSWRGYRRIRPLMAGVLRRVDQIAAQNEEYAERFRDLGAPRERVVVTGSMKFDGVESDRNNRRTQALRRLAGLTGRELVFLAGSTQAPEEEICVSVFKRLRQQQFPLILVIVPRHPERFDEVAAFLSRSRVPWCRRSELGGPHGTERQPGESVILVDTIGELGAWWGLAAVGFVGGSLGSRGGQNMIEPCAYGVATCFGPNTRNFRDVVELLCQHDAACVVRDGAELHAFVSRCITDLAFREALAERARRLVRQQRGATAVTCDLIRSLVSTGRAVDPPLRPSAGNQTHTLLGREDTLRKAS